MHLRSSFHSQFACIAHGGTGLIWGTDRGAFTGAAPVKYVASMLAAACQTLLNLKVLPMFRFTFCSSSHFKFTQYVPL